MRVIHPSKRIAEITVCDKTVTLHGTLGNIEMMETLIDLPLRQYVAKSIDFGDKLSTMIRVFECFSNTPIRPIITDDDDNIRDDFDLDQFTEDYLAYLTFLFAPNEVDEALQTLQKLDKQDKKKDLKNPD